MKMSHCCCYVKNKYTTSQKMAKKKLILEKEWEIILFFVKGFGMDVMLTFAKPVYL